MSYVTHGIHLSDGQKAKVAAAVKAGQAVSIRLARHELSGPHQLKLTRTQVTRLQKAAAAGTGAELTLSASQLKASGGFVQMLLPLLAAAAGPIISAVIDKVRGKSSGSGLKNGPRTRLGRGIAQAGYTSGMGLAQAGYSSGMGLYLPGVRKL